MKKLFLKASRRTRRKHHIRKRISGDGLKPRLSVYKSLSNIYVQLIDDVQGVTILSASTLDKDIQGLIKPEMKKVDKSKLVGSAIAKRALEKDIKSVSFDRNGYLYHGRVKAVADGAREGGLVF